MRIMVHAHTTFSNDGDLHPEQLARVAARHGFDAVLVTDHFESLTPESFRALVQECRRISHCWMIPGYERSWKGYHVLALGVDQWFDDDDIAVWAQKVRQCGGLVVLAHPVRYRHAIPEYILNACDGVEVWNSKRAYDGSTGPHPKAFELLGKDRIPTCGQDFHGVRHLTSVAMELHETCTSLSAVVRCIRSGKYRMANTLLRYGTELSPFAALPLGLIHRVRRRLVDTAIRGRRIIRSHPLMRPLFRPRATKAGAAPAEN